MYIAVAEFVKSKIRYIAPSFKLSTVVPEQPSCVCPRHNVLRGSQAVHQSYSVKALLGCCAFAQILVAVQQRQNCKSKSVQCGFALEPACMVSEVIEVVATV